MIVESVYSLAGLCLLALVLTAQAIPLVVNLMQNVCSALMIQGFAILVLSFTKLADFRSSSRSFCEEINFISGLNKSNSS